MVDLNGRARSASRSPPGLAGRGWTLAPVAPQCASPPPVIHYLWTSGQNPANQKERLQGSSAFANPEPCAARASTLLEIGSAGVAGKEEFRTLPAATPQTDTKVVTHPSLRPSARIREPRYHGSAGLQVEHEISPRHSHAASGFPREVNLVALREGGGRPRRGQPSRLDESSPGVAESDGSRSRAARSAPGFEATNFSAACRSPSRGEHFAARSFHGSWAHRKRKKTPCDNRGLEAVRQSRRNGEAGLRPASPRSGAQRRASANLKNSGNCRSGGQAWHPNQRRIEAAVCSRCGTPSPGKSPTQKVRSMIRSVFRRGVATRNFCP